MCIFYFAAFYDPSLRYPEGNVSSFLTWAKIIVNQVSIDMGIYIVTGNNMDAANFRSGPFCYTGYDDVVNVPKKT